MPWVHCAFGNICFVFPPDCFWNFAVCFLHGQWTLNICMIIEHEPRKEGGVQDRQ